MPSDLFSDLSTTLGVGQHMTLSLKSAQDTTIIVSRALIQSTLERHHQSTVPWVIMGSLSGILQAALQFALSNIQCSIPAFGVWGIYAPFTTKQETDISSSCVSILPQWLEELEIESRTRLSSFFRSSYHLNQSLLPPIIKSSVMGSIRFWVSVMPLNDSPRRLTVWGKMLLQLSSSPTVVLCGAKHQYCWRNSVNKFPNSSILLGTDNSVDEWRQGSGLINFRENYSIEGAEMVDRYKAQCRQYATSLIERFSGACISEPLWGPVNDPVDAIYVTVIWNPRQHQDGSLESLLTMPLHVRSRQKRLDRHDWIEMEESVERSILNPINTASSFQIEVATNKESSPVNLAAFQRLLLAVMIRTAVLPPNTLIHQLSDETEMDFFNNDAVEIVTENLLNKSGVSSVTRRMVKAIDWSSLSDDMIEGWEAERIVKNIMDGSLTLSFPSPPDEVFVDPLQTSAKGLFAPLQKSAPVGRLLSTLFVHMSRLKSPSSMALVWTYFLHDLRNRFYARTSLPNMGYVPGIDPPLELMREKRGVLTTGLRSKAENASFVHCSEPQPDDLHCLIGQKLQVFNICIENLVASGLNDSMRIERSFDLEQSFEHDEKCSKPGNLVDHVPPGNAKKNQSFNNFKSFDDRSVDFGSVKSDSTKRINSFSSCKSFDDRSSTLFEYYDALESDQLNRPGARCPVYGETLSETGDQLYAPYLLRPVPWTDDSILERKFMLSTRSKTSNLKDRLALAHRLLEPILISDMSAFKSANPGANYHDFVSWYGKPVNIVNEFEETLGTIGEDTEMNLDIDEDTSQFLKVTRDFWILTWDKAIAQPAIKQDPLFDVLRTVEVNLDSLETIHPANLLNQITAVNLSSAYFAMVAAAGEALSIRLVELSLEVLREKIESALEFLSRDAARGTTTDSPPSSVDQLPPHASLESIRSCEDACNAMNDSEILLSKAISLLCKFPQQYEFVEKMLNSCDHDILHLNNVAGRQAILRAIEKQQHKPIDDLPLPSCRSYIFRNTDEIFPCQLSVRSGEEAKLGKEKCGGTVLGLTITKKN
eukprot:CAMPEP_0194141066 /NCGR_PEP_ID=MMETSP0152-20130528/10546_1 /TAXON_ID=1049557 /ORGANISM="Thalassiothrix antarctica, Strain L6-D1" /LENGTH=1046 /DNA_ID=CAMNT_0038839573 /DNA_START=408 /DNA_END=3548 /DNA_ORIENTATION=-